ncbi:MAG: hypothetical protein NXI22_13180, partial [bacterium]|nr:hypothetical protein [bacterium]
LSIAGVVGRIWVISKYVESRNIAATPFLSANDRSRWCTIRSLVDHGTYVIDDVILLDPDEPDEERHKFDSGWQTIDMVRHRGADGKEHYYSSKPPLLPTLVAGEYWLLKTVTGATLVDQPYYVGCIIMSVTNGGLMLLFLLFLTAVVERYGKSDWGRIFVVGCGSFGTLLSSFAVSLNNHLPAAAAVMIVCWAALAIWQKEARFWHFLLAGVFAAFAVANELPALAFFAAVTIAIFWKAPKQAALFYTPAAAVVIVAFFYTTYIGHDSWRPPYAHRKDGAVIAEVTLPSDTPLSQRSVPQVIRDAIEDSQNITLSPTAITELRQGFLENDQWRDRWTLFDPVTQMRWAIVEREDYFEIREWDNWYDYTRSYWKADSKAGVDRGEDSRVVYAFHMLIGHHGIFSLTPIWLISVAGIYMIIFNRKSPLRPFAVMTILISLVVIAFYIARPEKDRNYGGVSCGMRWLLWLVPMWLICMIPAADVLRKSRYTFIASLGLLAMSAISVAFSAVNPWSHPWIYQYLAYLDPDTYE